MDRASQSTDPWAAYSRRLHTGTARHAEKLDVAAAEPGVGGKQSCQGREVLWVVSL